MDDFDIQNNIVSCKSMLSYPSLLIIDSCCSENKHSYDNKTNEAMNVV